MSSSAESGPRPWRALARVALWTALGIALLELVWLGFFRWAEGSGRLQSWMNRRPEKARVHFAVVRSTWPGLVEVEGLSVRGRTERGIDWQVDAERVRLQLDLLPLAWRAVRVRRAEIAGVSVLSRRPREEGEGEFPHAPLLEPLLLDVEKRAARREPPPPRPRRRPRWTLDFRNLVVEAVHELALDEIRVEGELRGEVGFALRMAAGVAEVYDSRLALAGVSVAHRGEIVARDLDGTVEAALSPYLYKSERGRDLVPHASGRLRLRGELDERPVVAELLRRAPWLEIESGVAPLDADFALRRGRLLDGGRLSAHLGRQRVRALDFEIEGESVLDLATGGEGRPSGEARWQLRFEEYVFRRRGLAQPLLRGRGLAVGGRSEDGRLADFAERAPLHLELGEARLPDLRFLAEWLPPAARIEQLEGSAAVRGELVATVADRRPSGTIEVDFDRVALRWAGNDFHGRLETRVAISGGDLEARRLELAGSELLLADFASPVLVPSGEPAPKPWWLHLELPEGGLVLGPPLTFDGRFETRLKDTAPLVALFETRRDLPRWAERLLTEEDVRASGRLRAGDGDLALDQLDTELLGGRLSMRLRFLGERRRGKLLLAWRRLAIGAGFDGERREIRIDDARDWFRVD